MNVKFFNTVSRMRYREMEREILFQIFIRRIIFDVHYSANFPFLRCQNNMKESLIVIIYYS